MSVEPLLTGTAAAASVVLPPVLMRGFKQHGIVAFFASVILANVIAECVFRLAVPDFHDGPLYPLGIMMDIVLTAMLAGISVAFTAIISDWVENQK